MWLVKWWLYSSINRGSYSCILCGKETKSSSSNRYLNDQCLAMHLFFFCSFPLCYFILPLKQCHGFRRTPSMALTLQEALLHHYGVLLELYWDIPKPFDSSSCRSVSVNRYFIFIFLKLTYSTVLCLFWFNHFFLPV